MCTFVKSCRVTLRSHISERDQNVYISDFFFNLCHSRRTSFLFHPLFSDHWGHSSREHIYLSVPFPLSHSCIQGNTETCRGFLPVRGRVGWSLSEQHPLLFIRPFTSTLTTCMKFKTTFLQQQLTAVRVEHMMFSCFLLCLWISASPSWRLTASDSLDLEHESRIFTGRFL